MCVYVRLCVGGVWGAEGGARRGGESGSGCGQIEDSKLRGKSAATCKTRLRYSSGGSLALTAGGDSSGRIQGPQGQVG